MTSELFFIASKIVGILIRGETWLILGLFVAVVACWRGARRLATVATALCLAAVLVLTVLPVGDWAIRPLEARYPVKPALDAPPAGIIVLGGAVEVTTWQATGLVHLNDSAERLTEAATLARRYPEAQILLSGGGASLADFASGVPTEARVMEALLTDLGIDRDRLLLEGRSRNTADNAAGSRDLVEPAPGETWLLVTSASHMPRAMATFERAGWTGLTAWPVDLAAPPQGRGPVWDLPLNLYYLNRAVKEYVGIFAYAAADRL